jgi:predicted TPR repeat methyltransferase
MTYLDQWLNPENPELYDSIIYNDESYDSFIWSLQQPMLRQLAKSQRERTGSLRYLDFACGTGRVLTALEDLADEANGIDLAPPMVERARLKSSANVVVADILDPSQRPEGMFDLITAFRFFLNVDPETREGVMRVLASLLRPGTGRLVFNIHGNKTSTAALVRLKPDAARSSNLMGTGEVRRLVEGAGLHIVSQEGFGLSPRSLYHGGLARQVRAVDHRLSGPRLSRISHEVVYVCSR